jgi:DNA-binding PadR family transcriptional regulator
MVKTPRKSEKKVPESQQDEIISRQNRRIQIDLRKAVFPNTVLFLLKKRPHYAREIREKIVTYIHAMADFLEDNTRVNPIFTRSLTIQKNLIYSNLVKLERQGVLASYKEKSPRGPQRKYYYLTTFGHRFFDEVVQKGLYPRVFFLHYFMSTAMGEDDLKNQFSQKDWQTFKKLYDILVE